MTDEAPTMTKPPQDKTSAADKPPTLDEDDISLMRRCLILVRQSSMLQKTIAFLITAFLIFVAAMLIYAVVDGFYDTKANRTVKASGKRQVLVLVVLGMRWDAVQRMADEPFDVPGFRRLMEEGIRASSVEPVFPSSEAPAWATLQTGLHPESHGILGNAMYDRRRRAFFAWGRESARAPQWWARAEPLWAQATRAGLRVAALHWPSADVALRGAPLPQLAKSQRDASLEERLMEAMSHLADGKDLVLLAYDGLDAASRDKGPFSTAALSELERVGDGLQTLLEFADSTGRKNTLQLLLLSDRGYSKEGCAAWDNAVAPPPPPPALESLEGALEAWLDDGPLTLLYLRPGKEHEALRKLSRDLHPAGYMALPRANISERLHYKGGPCAPDILVLRVEDMPCVLLEQFMDSTPWPQTLPDFNEVTTESTTPAGKKSASRSTVPSTLVAWGSAFAAGNRTLSSLHLVDVYQVIAHVLGLPPKPHNGSWQAVKDLF